MVHDTMTIQEGTASANNHVPKWAAKRIKENQSEGNPKKGDLSQKPRNQPDQGNKNPWITTSNNT